MSDRPKIRGKGSRLMAVVAAVLFVIVVVWWALLLPFEPEVFSAEKYIWGSVYQVLALWGAICGFIISWRWGGIRSVLGRSLFAFSVGLLLQVFGQSTYSYYNLVADIQAPYPSLGDVGFFGSVIAYIYGITLLAKASGAKVSLRSYGNQVLAFVIPAVVLALSYIAFLREYEFDWAEPIRVFLDFGYPLGQAIYVSLALLTLLLTRRTLGGVMKAPILFIVVVLLVQYISDYNFLYQAFQESWFVGGYGDMLYATSYFLMGIGLIYIGRAFEKVTRS